ncbi:MAG: aminoacyl-tRNA hydrolase, partial [Bifidobacteriaceae bacterium]|nr:aminoacyl-tRNA hydrolase [Bifidobacteriaceae bacterium]
LGNPGPDHARNRHNLGFMAVDALAGRTGATFARRAHGRALAGAARVGVRPGGAPGPRAVLAKPVTFMNLSGGPVAELASYFGVDLANLVVVHDDVDLPAWQVRLRRGGGEGGHNGLRSISQALGSKDYFRVRLGLGRPPGRQDTAAYVLQDFPAAQRPDVALLADKAADAVERLILDGLDAAQLAFHTRPKPPAGTTPDAARATDGPPGGARGEAGDRP